MSVRLTIEQSDAIRRRAKRRHVTQGEALRELLDAGRLQDQAHERGVVVTQRAIDLIGSGLGAVIEYGAIDAEGVTPEVIAALGLDDAQAEALREGAVLMLTTEETGIVAALIGRVSF
jgi:hypothetical protein